MKNKLNRLLTMNTGRLVSVFIVVNKFTCYYYYRNPIVGYVQLCITMATEVLRIICDKIQIETLS